MLRCFLEDAPWAIVGECGLDRNSLFRSFFDCHQVPVFIQHLRLATELHRPISIHSVKADGMLVDTLKREVESGRGLPPTLCLHSFSGSLETLKRIIAIVEPAPSRRGERREANRAEKGRDIVERNEFDVQSCRVFVGFNAWTNLFKKKASHLVQGIATDIILGESRLLVESDWNPVDFDFSGSDKRDADKILLHSVIDLASMLGWSPTKVAQTVAANTLLFLDPVIKL
mmetsp:Transcript_37876/g.113206  ORF Transcript_37876/g.113206 Transcript_37876/m.113206 type:complete len:229 (-) Transcript_37876:93-779(-)